MLHLIPAPLHRVLYRIADRVRRRWWRLRKPTRHSVFVVAFDGGKALLVRHSYGPPVWTLPGGGRRLSEDPAAAMAREFREELQCPLSDMCLLASVVRMDAGSANHRHVFIAELAGAPRPDRREIMEARLFDPAELPANTTRWAAENVRLAAQARLGGTP